MYTELFIYSYAATVGFVSAGIIGSFYQLLTAEAPQFRVSDKSFLSGFGSVMLCCFSAPFIIMRNAIRGRRIERRPLGWLVASVAISLMWSACTGIILLEFIIALRGPTI
ncbi:MAG: hypothetical protein R3D02_11955 [Hyphomicrobiales bacterium]